MKMRGAGEGEPRESKPSDWKFERGAYVGIYECRWSRRDSSRYRWVTLFQCSTADALTTSSMALDRTLSLNGWAMVILQEMGWTTVQSGASAGWTTMSAGRSSGTGTRVRGVRTSACKPTLYTP